MRLGPQVSLVGDSPDPAAVVILGLGYCFSMVPLLMLLSNLPRLLLLFKLLGDNLLWIGLVRGLLYWLDLVILSLNGLPRRERTPHSDWLGS